MKVELSRVTKRFGGTVAVDGFTATLADGQLIALLGPSGCGKSTLLNLLAGILPATGGRIFFDGDDVTAWPPERRGVGLVFQNYALYPHMTVAQNISFPLEIKKVPKPERARMIREIASMVHVEDLLDRRPDALSGGQQQRVAIARALVKRPRLLLLDEPLSNLDARLRLEMREEIRRVQRETGVTTVFVTHDQEEAMSISDQIVLMRDGRLQQCAPAQTLYHNPVNRFAAEFLGNPPINQIPGTVSGNRFTLKNGGAEIPLPFDAGLADRPAILAVRAESFQLDEDGVPCVIADMFEIGKEEMASLTIGGESVRAYLPLEAPTRKGDTVRVRLKPRGVFLFDGKTGDRL
ncbi:MAG: ABC transporter ATP-binding protein [Oscillospiraceae bacterium]|jgi:multiple sugar transport system ATP-binding protein|nr:ABC transporter ATP-binding protein [Oscillospiraceae bacterium]